MHGGKYFLSTKRLESHGKHTEPNQAQTVHLQYQSIPTTTKRCLNSLPEMSISVVKIISAIKNVTQD